MTSVSPTDQSEPDKAKSDKSERLAQALRANLARRKEQKRSRESAPSVEENPERDIDG